MRRTVLTIARIAGLVLAAALFAAWQHAPVPNLLKALPIAVLALSLARPSLGLLAMAGFGPIVGGLAVVQASPFGATHAFEQLVLAVLIGSGLRFGTRQLPLRLAEPALLLATVAVASAIAVQPALVLRQMPGASAAEYIVVLLSGGYFDRGMMGEPLTFAVITAESLALALVAERHVREEPALAARILRMTVVGHAGLAMISIDRLAGAALRTEDAWPSLLRLAREVRISTYADLNAAGSVLAMVLLAGCGLLVESPRWRTLSPIALAVVGAGLWISGSRTALAALAIVVCGGLLFEAIRRRGRARWIAVAATAAVLVAGLGAAVRYPAVRNVSASTAIGARAFLARIGVEMWRTSPVLGIGIGRFWAESSNFGGPDRLFGIVNENAHNNFLQVLAEQGIVGLLALVVALAAVFMAPASRAAVRSALGRFLAAGLVVFMLTWLGGHPLLQAEASFAFWLLAGVFAGMGDPPTPGRWRTMTVVGAALLLLTAPVRADRAIRNAGLEYLGAGVSGWRPELDGVRYREAGPTFKLYLPADGTAVTLPMRRAPQAPDPLTIASRVGRYTLPEVRLSGDAWLDVPIQLPNANRRFELVEFSVTAVDPIAPTPLVFVGKTVVRSR